MALPIVAIVGRPNVGKSSLFNWLAGRRISIVDPTAGVTRDRVSTVVEHGGRAWELSEAAFGKSMDAVLDTIPLAQPELDGPSSRRTIEVSHSKANVVDSAQVDHC